MGDLNAPFFLREDIRCRVHKRVEALEKGYRQNLALLGQEGLGKTHVLRELYQRLLAKPEVLPVYIDAGTLDGPHLLDRWMGSVLWSLFSSQTNRPSQNFQSLIRAAEPIVPKTTEQIKAVKKLLRKEKNTAAVRELFSLTATIAEETRKKVVLLIDEFQGISVLPAPDPFALFGKEIMVEPQTLYLVTSSRPVRAKEIFHDKLSLLFGNFEILELFPMGFSEVIENLKGQMAPCRLSPAQEDFMVRMTDGYPTYLNCVAKRLREMAKYPFRAALEEQEGQALNVPELLAAFHYELFDPRGHLKLLFEKRLAVCGQFGREDAVCVRALLALSFGRRKILSIAAFIERKVPDTKKILQRLLREEIIVKRGSFYMLEDALFRFWLREVYERRIHTYGGDAGEQSGALYTALQKEFEISRGQEVSDLAGRMQHLLREFRNDVVEVENRKIQCPQFSEIAFRPTNGRVFPILAKNPKVRWVCQVAYERVSEEDVSAFVDEMKRYRKRVQRRVLVTVSGIDQNAKLMAQEAKIQLWDLRSLNALLDLYNLPKIYYRAGNQGEAVKEVLELSLS